jgi:hypothetical protein
MLQDIARVFSSNGVLIPGSEAIPVYGGRNGGKSQATGACDHKGPDCHCFGPKFDQASAKLELSQGGRERQASEASRDAGDPGSSSKGAGSRGADGKPLTPDQEKQVRELEKRDREVKAHEAAHQAAAGGQARGGAAFEYRSGPDGKSYAVGGHVDIDVSPVSGNPQATLEKARTAQRAALAPADPSGQDRSVAAAAVQMAAEAEKEIARGGDEEGGAAGGTEPADGEGRAAKDGSGGSKGNGAGAGPAGAARFSAYARPRAAGAALNVFA